MADRAVTEQCVVMDAYDNPDTRSRGEFEGTTHTVDCPSGTHEYLTDDDEALAVGEGIERSADPAGWAGEHWGDLDQLEGSLTRGVYWTVGLVAGGLLLRWWYLAGRIRYEAWKRALPGADAEADRGAAA